MMRKVAFAVVALVLLAAPLLISGYVVYLLCLIGVFSLVAIGLNLLTGYSGQISLGHSAFFAMGAYASALLVSRIGLPFWIALPVASALAALIGAVVALPALRLKNLYLAIATLGAGIVVQRLIFEWRSGDLWTFMPEPLVNSLFAAIAQSPARAIPLGEVENDRVLQAKFTWLARRHFESSSTM